MQNPILIALALTAFAFPTSAATSIRNAEIWPDDNGVHINAHGGCVIHHGGRYWWYGEHKVSGDAGNRAHGVAVHVYSSVDLVNWRDEGAALSCSTDPKSEIGEDCIIERPKVVFCSKTGKFVMYFHHELKGLGYTAAHVGIAVADRPQGPFAFVRSKRPNAGALPQGFDPSVLDDAAKREAESYADLKNPWDPAIHPKLAKFPYVFYGMVKGGQMSQDQTLFVDDDGKAYHVYASEYDATLHVSELTDDYLDMTGRYWRIAVNDFTEAPAICKHGGWYYLIGSGCTGWAPNKARLYRAKCITGPWERLGNPCQGVNAVTGQGSDLTWGGQSNYILKVPGRDLYIAMFDIWRPKDAIDGRYVWLPIDFSGETPVVRWQTEWRPDVAAKGIGAECGSVRLKGYVGERLDAMIERHVIGTDIAYITAPFLEKTERRNWWQTEFWGKFMHSAVPYIGYSGSERLKKSVAEGVERILSSQEPCGYIGNYPDELRCGKGWDVWGMKYTMMGLMHDYDMTHETRVLDAAKRLCDYVIGELGPKGRRGCELWETGNWSGYASSSILEPVMWLYKRTKEQKYLDFATYIVKGATEPETGPRLLDLALKGISVADRNGYGSKPEADGRYVMKYNRWKAYEMMSCYQGFIEYYEVTGRKDLYEAALAAANDIAKEEINLAGGCTSSEAWFHGARKQHLPYYRLQETCVTTTWMRLCEKFLDLTGDPIWADRLEQSFYNIYLASLKADGSCFAAYTPLSGSRYYGHHHCYMHTNCCNANGARGFLCFLREFFRADGKAMTFNFYGSALAKTTLPNGQTAAFDMYSTYPRGDSVRIVSHTENVGKLPLRLRLPAWCGAKTVVKLNGQPLPGVKAGGYFAIENEWKLGDIVEIAFDMPVVVHKYDHNLAFTRGPVLLARDSRFNDGDLTEPFRYGFKDGQVVPAFTPVRSPSDDIWMAFSAALPIGLHTENPEGELPETVTFCDYASAGNTWNRDNYYRTWFQDQYGPRD